MFGGWLIRFVRIQSLPKYVLAIGPHGGELRARVFYDIHFVRTEEGSDFPK